MGFKVVKGDLLDQKVDAIVIPSRPSMSLEGGLGTAIANITGEKIKKQINKIPAADRYLEMGEASFPFSVEKLPCKKAILVAATKYSNDYKAKDEARVVLHQCYINALKKALEHNFKSIAFPLLSSGAYGFPKHEAAKVAIKAMNEFFDKNKTELQVSLVIKFASTYKACRETFNKYAVEIEKNGGKLTSERSEKFIKDTEREIGFGLDWLNEEAIKNFESGGGSVQQEQNYDKFKAYFDFCLVKKGISFKKCYEGVISRQAFDKIYCKGSIPKKYTLIALGVNMGLDLESIENLLDTIGKEFDGSQRDRAIRYGIWRHYDIETLNETLKDMGVEPLPTHAKTK